MRAGTLIAFVVLFALLAGAGWYAFAGLPATGEELPADYYVARSRALCARCSSASR
jgi:hypothetical protein